MTTVYFVDVADQFQRVLAKVDQPASMTEDDFCDKCADVAHQWETKFNNNKDNVFIELWVPDDFRGNTKLLKKFDQLPHPSTNDIIQSLVLAK